MGQLTNPRHERFCDEIDIGRTGTEAYAIAFGREPDATARANASRLLADADIQERLAQKRRQRQEIAAKATEKAAEALSIDRQWVMARLVENVERAMQAEAVKNSQGQVTGEYKYDGSVANKALELLGKEFGMFVERTENVNVNHEITSEPLTDVEWAEQHATAAPAHH